MTSLASESVTHDLEALVALLAGTEDAEARLQTLVEAAGSHTPMALAERLKAEAERARYRDAALSARWSDDIVALGQQVDALAVVALGRMVEAATLCEQNRYRESLARFDEASALFRACGDEVGWARTQIGRTATCMALARFDETLERAEEARAILERVGDRMRAASIDNNLALLLERMKRPAEALVYSQRALAIYHDVGADYYAIRTLANHALLLWRLGHIHEALKAHREARQGFAALGAMADTATEDLNIGVVELALGHYAEAVHLLTATRQVLLAAPQPYAGAMAGLHLSECYLRLGRFRAVVTLTAALDDEFAACDAVVERAQALVWRALARTALHDRDAARRGLDAASGILAPYGHLAAHRAALDLARAQLLLDDGDLDTARAVLEAAIPVVREAGLSVDAAAAQVLRGVVLLEDGLADEARVVAGDTLAIAEREGLDWLAAQSLHLRGRAASRQGDNDQARRDFGAAVRRLDRVQRRVTWDDRATFGDTTGALYTDAMALALHAGDAAIALRHAERLKAGALADHLRARIDVRPRARDDRSRLLVGEMERLRERYAWLNAARADELGQAGGQAGIVAPVRWAVESVGDTEARDEASRIERRLAEIWRELQAGNPAYQGEAAALDLIAEDGDPDDGEVARRWVARLHAALGSDDVALLEYAALGDDLVLFVARAGRVRALRLHGADLAQRRLTPLLRLNVERCAGSVRSDGAVPRALATNARGVLRRLHDVLLKEAMPLLDGAARLVVEPHGAGHHVPFHALHDGHGYVVERLEVSYAPCAGLVEHFAARHRLVSAGVNGVNGVRQGALALACSDGGALPHVASEGEAVVSVLGGRLLRESEATLDALRAAAGDCVVLHLAAHACFRPDEPLFSALRLHDGPLTTLEVFDLELSCSLATLSACETALGTAGAGDELMGLSRAFLYAGAPSLLLSLWKVEDRSTAVLMAAFYRALHAGATKAAALRQAQLALLRGEGGPDRDDSAPFFWAPFELIGHAGRL